MQLGAKGRHLCNSSRITYRQTLNLECRDKAPCTLLRSLAAQAATSSHLMGTHKARLCCQRVSILKRWFQDCSSTIPKDIRVVAWSLKHYKNLPAYQQYRPLLRSVPEKFIQAFSTWQSSDKSLVLNRRRPQLDCTQRAPFSDKFAERSHLRTTDRLCESLHDGGRTISTTPWSALVVVTSIESDIHTQRRNSTRLVPRSKRSCRPHELFGSYSIQSER